MSSYDKLTVLNQAVAGDRTAVELIFAPISNFTLTNQFWVDSAAVAGGNGSEITPFQTVQQAVTAAGANSCNINIATGVYADPISFPVPATGQTFSLHAAYSVGRAVTLSGAISVHISSTLLFENIYVHGNITYSTGTLHGGYYLILLSCIVDSTITDCVGGALTIVSSGQVVGKGETYNPSVLASVNIKGSLYSEKTLIGGPLTCLYCEANDTEFGALAPITVTTTGTRDGTTAMSLRGGCAFYAGSTYVGVTGKTVLIQDQATASNWAANPPTLTNSTVVHYPTLVQLTNGSAPATPVIGGAIYVEAGALKYIGSSGTITVLGLA